MGTTGTYKRFSALFIFLLNSIFLLAAPVVTIQKVNTSGVVQSNEYDTGETLRFKVRITNPGPIALTNIKIEAPLSGITSTLDGGGSGAAFSNLVNQVSDSSLGAIAGSVPLNGDFSVNGVDIPVGGFVEYFVRGTVNNLVNAQLTPVVTVKETNNTSIGTGNITLTRVPYTYTIGKTSPIAYYEKEGVVTYKVTITNTSSTTTIKDFKVEDILPSDLTGATITATSTGSSTAGSFSPSGNLIATGIEISPLGKVEYTITANVKAGVTTPIVNTATTTVRGQTESSLPLTLNLATYDYSIIKTTTTTNYTPGQNLTYKVRVQNNSSTVGITKMKIEDILSTITGTAANGSVKSVFVPGTITTTATASGGSSAGLFSPTGNLSATDVSIATNSFIEYTITGKVNDDIVGVFENTAKATDRNNVEKVSTITTTSVAPVMNLTKTQNPTSYRPGQTVTYTVTVRNTGTGIASNYLVEDLLAGITGRLGNNGTSSATDVASSGLLNTWTVNAALAAGSTKSLSDIISNGGTTSNTNLLDIVSVFPGESIIYTITTVAKDSAISNIVNVANLKKDNVLQKTATVTTTPVALANNSTVVITKVPTQIEYKPGDVITYNLTVTNPNNNFMNDITITDLINSIKATQIDGSLAPAFDSWDLSVLSTSGVGTASGTVNTTNNTGDLILTADIGPNGSIVYEIKAKTKLTTVGLIQDNTTISGDNVVETGPGVKMSTPILEVAKNVNTTEYVPGGTLIYTIDVDNPGDGYATNVMITDKLSLVTAQLIDGTTGPAFNSWNITSKIYDISGSTPVLVNSVLDPTSAGTYSPTADINITNAILGPNRRITYTIEAVLNPKAKGAIKNLATVNGAVYSDKGSQTKVSKISIEKTTPISTYVAGGTTTITYDVVVKNDATAGVAIGIKVEDKVSEAIAALLSDGTTTTAFSSWTISAPVLTGSETKSTLTTSISNVDLVDTVNISPAGSVKYTITATLKTPTSTNILYGPITNTAKADGLIASATTTPKLPNLNVSKTAISGTFIPGGTVSFKVVVSNNGEGYANDALIKDILNSTYFENIEINGTPTGLGTTTGISNPINTDLNAVVDIAPGGKVEYTITAKVKASYLGNTVSNTVEVTDTQNNLTTTTSATITKNGGSGNLLDFVKRSNNTIFEPGGTITYFIDVINRLGSEKVVTVKDVLSNIKATYANDLALENVTDMPNQPAFDTWNIFRDLNNSNPTSVLGSPKTDLNDTITIPGNSTMTYKIVATVNPRVVTTQLTNIATVLEGTTLIGTSSVQHNIVPPGGGVTREVNKSTYIPGVDTIKYTITATSTGPGYQNNLSINELVKDLTVPLIDGTVGNPFNGVFTVTKIVTNETDGTETVFTVGPANNENLIGLVDVKPGEKVQYVIEGLVRKDAIGTINNNGLVTVPFRWNLQNTKSVLPSKYEPGGYITYTITIKNNSNGNAQNIPVSDDFNVIKVTDSTGALVSALSDITVDLANSTATGFKADLGNPTITAGVLTATPDIPIGGVIVYKIKAKVTDKAVGFITNTAIVDGDAVSNQVGPSIDKPEIKKEVLKFYKPDGTTVLTNRYMPGGFIEYKVTLKNTGKGILNNGTFLDEIGAITTNYATTGVTGPAFDSWTITKLSETGASTVADINNSIPLGTEVLNSAAKPKIEGLMDIHPGGEIVYIIKAKINENAVGNITNTASLNGLKSAVTSLMQNPTINHTKQVFEENGTTVKTTFLPGDKVVYKMRVENTGFGTSASKTYTDIVANIVGEIAETPGSVAIPTANVFASYTASFTTSGGNVTTIGSAGLNQTINLPNSVTIAPGGWIEFRIDATLKDTVIGRFTNRSTYDRNNKDVSLNPVPPVITAKKTLTKLNGVDFVAGMTYAPGDSVEYKVEIENIGSSFFNNLAIGDNLDAIVTSLTGDATGKGLENISISSPVVTNTLSKPVLTDIKPSAGNSSTNLQVEVDFAPKDKIVYTITGNIVKSAIGTIPANIAIVNGVSYPSNPINPKAPIISSKKELIAPANKIYGPNEVVEYKITIENTGEGFGNDIKIVDLISDIKTTLLNGSQGQAFVNWTITSLITHSNTAFNGQTILQNALADNTNINTEVDIAPSGKVEITIKATTSSLAAGEIINIAKIDNVEKPSDKINPRTAVVEFNKVPLITGSTTYTPGGDIGFRLVLSNTSTNAIAKDINLSDLVSTIKVDSSNGGQVPAFQSGWIYEIVSVSGDSTKFATSGITNGVDISAGKVTLGPGENVAVRIKGKAATTAIGNIVNTGNASYNGTDLGPKTVTLTPAPGIADLSKVVNKESYTVGGKLIYTIVVKNTGTGYLNDVTIIDDLKLIETELATGGVGKAIDSFNVVTLTKTNAATIITRDTTYANGFKATGDIYPGDTVTIVIEATLNPLAAGKITNIAKVLDSSGNEFSEDKTNNTTTVNPLPAIVQILKTVDKATYISGDTLTYKVVVENTGTGWANGIKVTDDISGILADIGGASVGAFESWTIAANKVAGSDKVVLDNLELTNTATLTSNSNLDAKVSLAPLSAIEFTIVAKLKANTTTDIKNIAKYQYDPNNPSNPTTDPKLSNEVITTPKVTELTITKLQNNLRERSGFTANPVQYWLDDVILYQIVVQNGENAINNFEIVDNIQQILVGGSGGSNIPAYSQWSIDSIVYSDGTPGPISTKPSGIATQPSGENISVKTSLKAGEKVTVTIRAQITKGDETNLNFPQSVIKNTASIVVEVADENTVTENSNEVIFTPYPPVLERSKTITSIGGVDYTPGMTYSPGDKVVYTIGLRNTGNGVADNITVKDDIASVVTELAGGTIGSAFSTWTVTLDKSPAAKVDGTYPLSSPSTIDDIVDLGPDKYVNFIIEATVATNAIGTISPNIAIINGEDKVTPPIPPKAGTAPSLTKKIVVEDSRLDKSEYSAGDTIVYEVTVSNLNDKIWLNDVNVVDLISDVKALNLAGVEVAAFKPNWKIEMSNLKAETIFSGTYPKNNVNLNETMDLAPGDVVKFKITATINENIVGKIINTTTGTYKKNKTETPPLEPVSVESDSKIGLAKITKSPFEDFYSPGGVIGFDIVIENISTELINDLKLTDLISKIKASKIGEPNPVPVFKSDPPNWTITYQVVGDTVNTDATLIPATGDIDAVNLDIGKNTKIIIQIRGTAADRIYGDIINTASYEYPDTNENKEVTAVIKPKDPVLTLVKNVNTPEYGPQDEIVYTIEIQNTGIGAAIGVELEDAIGALETTLVGIAAPGTGLAFTSWTRELTSVPVTSSVVSEITDGDTYKAKLDIAPSDKIIITLRGVLDERAYGKIDNLVLLTYRDGQNTEKKLEANAETTGKSSELFIRKTINKNVYEDGDTLVFTVLLQNGGLGWGNNIVVEDKISEILDSIVGPAFESWSIKVTKSSELSSVTTNPESLDPPTPDNKDLNVLVDVAPISQVGFEITAKLKPNVSSTIKNTAYMQKTPDSPKEPSPEVIAEPTDGTISITKSVEESVYVVGEKLTYIIEVKNSANILARDVVIKDALNSIKVVTNLGIEINPFTSWKIVSVTPSSSTLPLTTPISILPAIGVDGTTDIEIKTNIKANETIAIKIEAIVALGNEQTGVPTGAIENKASVTYEEKEIFDTVKTTPGEPLLLTTKVIKSLAGNTFENQKYNSGDELVYEITVQNNGGGMAKDVSIIDSISTMTTELAGGTTGPVFETWSTVITKLKPTTLIQPSAVLKDTDINLIADIDKGEKIVITVIAKINSKAVGIISKNIVTVGQDQKETPEIDPEKGVLEFTKTIIDGTDYVQGGNIVYELKITNKSKTFINDVSFVDEISKIKATGLDESQVIAFKSWTVSRSDKGTGTIYNQAPNLSNIDINDKIDISPEDVLTYTVTAVVEDDVVGDIVNTGYVEYVGPEGIVKLERDVVSKTNPGDVRLTKEAINPTYVPNGEIGFRVVLENISTENVANNITIRDIISTIVADKIGGGTTLAFKPGWKITSRVEGDLENSNINSLLSLEEGRDIIDLVVDLGKASKVIIEIKGVAESNIYGDIKNIASFSYPEAEKSYEREAIIKSAQSIPELTKVVDKAEYNSGDTLEYTIRIKNPGLSIIPNFVLTDEIGKVVGEIAGESSSTGLAFASWQRVSLEIPSTSALKEELVKDSAAGDTYKAVLDLGVGDEVVLKLSAVTKPNVFGTLVNTAVGKYTEQGEGGAVEKEIVKQAVSTGKIGLLGLTKTVKTKTLLPNTSTYLYSPGEEIEYTIVVSNNGDGWVRNAILTDMFTEVQTKLYPNGDLGAAFENGTLSIEYVSSDSENSIVILEDNPNLKAEIDIKNGSTITFVAKIKVSTEAVSIIQNKAVLSIKVGEKEEVIEAKVNVFAQIPKVSLTKTVDLKEFNPSEKLVYIVTLENSGDNNIVGIEGTDIIKDIRSLNNLGEMVYPFEPEATITRLIEPENSVRVTQTETEEGNIVDKLDMKPKSKITYIIEVQVKDSIVGSIVNIAKAKILSQDGFGEDKNLESEVTSTPRKPVIAIEKTVITQLESDDKIVNGEEVTYTIKLKTDKIVFNVQLIDKISEIKNELGEALFDPETIKIVSVKEGESDIAYTGDINGSTSEIKISRIDTEAIVVIKATVKNNVSLKSGEKITNTASANYDQQNDGGYDLDIPVSDIADVVGKAMQLELTKVATQDQVLLGEEVEYIIKVKNSGSTRALNFTVIDNISEMTELSNSGSKIPAYTSWSITGVAGPNSLIGTIPGPNINLNITDAEIAPGETLTYTIKAKTSLDLNVQKVRNIAKVAIVGLPEIEAEAEVKIKKPLVSIDKEAGVKETSIGKFVPYSLVITNNESQPIKNLYIKDTPPAGFKYIEDSLGIIKNGEKVGTIDVTYEGNTIVIGPFDLESKEQIEVVYLTKVSIGVVRGTYKNVAVVTNTSGKPVSNEDAAEVDVVEDPLFETTTVIGKVFHDRDGDGIQDDNRATGISIKQDIPENLYVPNSTYYIVDGITKAIKDQSVPLERGIKLKEILHGRMSEREDLEKSKVEIYTGLNDVSNLGDIRVTTAEGTDITLTKDNRVITNHTGLKAKGMVSQNIVLRRQILKKATNKNRDNKIKYYQKITIINTGLIEEGIPGVRVANVEGLVIITDQYGRFHIPEVSDKKGKNYILKVDATTLPIGSIFTTENPKVQRLGTTMIKYNFGVVLPRTTYETKQDGTKLLRVRVFPGILFYENSSEIKPVVYKDVFSEIMKKLKSKDHLLVELNRSDNKELDEKRKQELLKALKEYLSDEKVKVQFIQSKKEAI